MFFLFLSTFFYLFSKIYATTIFANFNGFKFNSLFKTDCLFLRIVLVPQKLKEAF
ncbi:hypothetical protein IV70_GL002344 [Carnobacterium maltaromaticum DSM 20342]|nr:hypothetical protein IV70_GL002344 [Carnobacterium maltaromaticum DSM 20342]